MQAKPDISILMVDDEPANLLALEGILERRGVLVLHRA